jgi:hypothetical protein
MIVELIVISCVGILAYLAGNVMGWSSGKDYGVAKARFELMMEEPIRRSQAQKREELINHISRQSLAFSQKQKQWIKVYDAEVME